MTTPSSIGSTQNTTSLSITTKLSTVNKDIVVPDLHPRVRWHTSLHVELFRNVGDVLCALAFMIPFFVLGPSMAAMMYPNMIVPYVPSLEWKWSKLPSYSELKPSDLVLDTNLMTPASALNIQLYVKHSNTTFEDLQQIVLAVDDGGFDYQTDNVLLCRPSSNIGYQPNFNDYVKMVETCYLYIRQITQQAKILGFGRGIAGNALLAAAAKLRHDSCFQFEKILLKRPIPDVREEFEKVSWITRAFSLPFLRNSLVKDAMEAHGLNDASLKDNVEKVGKVPVYIISSTDYDKDYGNLGAGVQKKSIEDFRKELKLPPTPRVFNSTNFTYRHSSEEECVKTLRRPLFSVLVL